MKAVERLVDGRCKEIEDGWGKVHGRCIADGWMAGGGMARAGREKSEGLIEGWRTVGAEIEHK